MNYKLLLYTAVVLLFFSACKTSRTSTKAVAKGSIQVAEIIEEIQKKQPQFRTANVSKMSMAINMGNREVNVNATFKIQKDSVIHISIQPFMGIELFKAELTPDSLMIIDKMNKKYYPLDYSYFSQKFNVDVDFYSIQSLLFGQFFCIGNKDIKTDECKISELNNKINSVDYENEKMKQSTFISTDYSIQQVLLKSKNSNYELKTTYSDIQTINEMNFPKKIAMKASNEKNDASCDLSILKVEFNTPLKFTVTNLERYIKGNIDQLLKK